MNPRHLFLPAFVAVHLATPAAHAARTQIRPVYQNEASDDDPHLSNTIVVRLGERFAVEYERALHDKVSLFVGPALVAGLVSAGGTTVKNELGFGSTLGARFFVRGRAPEGLFIGPIVYLGYARVKERDNVATGLRLSSGAMVGYTTVFFDILAVSLGVGASYLNVTQVADGSELPGPVETNLRFALGVAY